MIGKIGIVSGNLVVISYAYKDTTKRKSNWWLCRCVCGKEVTIRQDTIGKTLSCGCIRKSIKKDITGKQFGRLKVIDFSHTEGKQYRSYWNCVCDCNTKLKVRIDQLTSGITKSCGCYQKDMVSIACTKHGYLKLDSTPEEKRTYAIWYGIIERCTNEHATGYRYYGGKGIKLDSRWEKIENFIADMGLCPKNYSIERTNIERNYTKDNCYWLPLNKQAQNRTNTIHITIPTGERLCLAEACRLLDVSYRKMLYQIKIGKSPEEALAILTI
jgi:hypothetical protein